jgi:hypothetical protein
MATVLSLPIATLQIEGGQQRQPIHTPGGQLDTQQEVEVQVQGSADIQAELRPVKVARLAARMSAIALIGSPLPTAHGLFASVRFTPLITTIAAQIKCVDCGQFIAVEYDAGPHSGVMAWCRCPCPHCGKSQEHSLPGPVVGIKKATT